MSVRIYLSPERRDPPHGSYYGYPELFERDYCEDIAARMQSVLEQRGFEVMVADRAKTIYRRVPEATAWNADYYMPLHTNASGNGAEEGRAQGALVLTAADAESQRAGRLVFERLNALRPSTRGVRQQLSFFEISEAEPPVVYPEIAFHDNGEDAHWLAENREPVALALCDGICDYFGVSVRQGDNHDELVARLRALVGEMSILLAEQG